MVKNVICIVQARSNSSRFPNKIFAKIGELNLLQWVDQRLSKSTLINQVAFALPETDRRFNIANFVQSGTVHYVPIVESDVLGRYYSVASELSADIVVRVTCDCPFIDPNIVDGVISKFIELDEIYLSNTNPPSFPDGYDVEVMKFEALEEAFFNAKSQADREHVTPFIIRNYARNNFESFVDLSNARLTVDTVEDLERNNNIFANLNDYHFKYKDTVALWKSKPELFISATNRNEGASMTNGYKLWSRAKESILGGNMLLSKRPEMFAPGIWPPYFKTASGIKVTDLDDITYRDFSLMGVGTNLLGYARSEVVQAVIDTVQNSNMSTLNCPEEVMLAEKLISMHPWAAMVKFARSGGEANTMAIRIARASSGREKVAICGYHGWHDWYLSLNLKRDELGDHLLTGLSTAGLPKQLMGLTHAFKYGDNKACKEFLKTKQFACVIMEVSRFSEPDRDFLVEVRKACDQTGTLLIFDECTSGFRQYFGGLHMALNIYPDLCMFGKALGNGHPITAILGRKKIMKNAEDTFISSTFWTDRVGPAAALETLKIMEVEKTWEDVSQKGKLIKKYWQEAASNAEIEITISGLDPLPAFTFVHPLSNKLKTIFIIKMLKRGYLASTSVYLSSAHKLSDLKKYEADCIEVFAELSTLIEKNLINTALKTEEAHTGFQRLN